jgi:hypothetical protein
MYMLPVLDVQIGLAKAVLALFKLDFKIKYCQKLINI